MRVLRHVQVCERCRTQYQMYQALQSRIDSKLVRHQAPPSVAWNLNRRIEAFHADAKKRDVLEFIGARFQWLWHPRPAMQALAIAAGFLIAVLGGIRLYQTVNGPRTSGLEPAEKSPLAEVAPENLVHRDLQDYLEKSEIILMQLKNRPANTTLVEEKRVARDLLAKSRLLKSQLRGKAAPLSTLMEDLEPILVDVANYDHSRDRQALDVWRQAIEQKDYLMRLEFAKATSGHAYGSFSTQK